MKFGNNVELTLSYIGYYINHTSTIEASGVYSVYVGTNNPDGTVRLRRLIYIGESQNIKARLIEHRSRDEWNDWKSYLHSGEQLVFAYAQVPSHIRAEVEAALIFRSKPPCNTEYKYNFPFDANVKLSIKGGCRFLSPSITVLGPASDGTGNSFADAITRCLNQR